MEADEARLEDARAWLGKAQLDLRAAAHELAAPDVGLLGDVMFHAQQAAEKAMKAFLAWHDVPFRRTHNLEELGRQCAALDATLARLADQAAPLTEYAWRFRYPGEAEEPTREEAKHAVATAQSVYEAIVSRLPPGARP
jgi:HEPN domain-containing protein